MVTFNHVNMIYAESCSPGKKTEKQYQTDYLYMWMFPKIWVYPPKSSHFNRVCHYKPSILGYPLFLETPIYVSIGKFQRSPGSYPRYLKIQIWWKKSFIDRWLRVKGMLHRVCWNFLRLCKIPIWSHTPGKMCTSITALKVFFSVGCILSCFGFSFVLLLASDVFGWLRDKSLAIMAVMELEEINAEIAEMSSVCPTMNIADQK